MDEIFCCDAIVGRQHNVIVRIESIYNKNDDDVNLLVFRKPFCQCFAWCDVVVVVVGEFGMKGIRSLSVSYALLLWSSSNRFLIDLFMISWLIEVVVDDVIELSFSRIIILVFYVDVIRRSGKNSESHFKLTFFPSSLFFFTLSFTLNHL